jgi:hypothetical protein
MNPTMILLFTILLIADLLISRLFQIELSVLMGCQVLYYCLLILYKLEEKKDE